MRTETRPSRHITHAAALLAMLGAVAGCATNPATGETDLDLELAAITLEATSRELYVLAPLFPRRAAELEQAAEALHHLGETLEASAEGGLGSALGLLEPLALFYLEADASEEDKLLAMRVRVAVGSARNLLELLQAIADR